MCVLHNTFTRAFLRGLIGVNIMNLLEKYNKGNGNRFVLVITYDEVEDFSNALQNVISDIGLGKNKNNDATDNYAYGFEIEKQEIIA